MVGFRRRRGCAPCAGCGCAADGGNCGGHTACCCRRHCRYGRSSRAGYGRGLLPAASAAAAGQAPRASSGCTVGGSRCPVGSRPPFIRKRQPEAGPRGGPKTGRAALPAARRKGGHGASVRCAPPRLATSSETIRFGGRAWLREVSAALPKINDAGPSAEVLPDAPREFGAAARHPSDRALFLYR